MLPLDFDPIVDAIVNILLFPLQVIFIPIDHFLAQIPGIGIIASSIRSMTSFVGSLPETLVNLIGLSPVLWNIFFTLFMLFIVLAPAINMVKKIWAWVRL